MNFPEGFNRSILIVVLIKYGVWTALNIVVLKFCLLLDHRLTSETLVSLLMIPVGIINFSVVINSVRKLKRFYWNTVLAFLFAGANFYLYILYSLDMYSQSGRMINSF